MKNPSQPTCYIWIEYYLLKFALEKSIFWFLEWDEKWTEVCYSTHSIAYLMLLSSEDVSGAEPEF